jgi:hypothetical protein
LASPFEFGGALLSIVIGGCNGKKKKTVVDANPSHGYHGKLRKASQ